MDRDDIVRLSFEDTLRELAKDLRLGRRLNLDDLYQLLEWASVFTLTSSNTTEGVIGFETEGVNYFVLFLSSDNAESVAAHSKRGAVAEKLRARELLERIPDGWGLIIEWDTDSELRISPDEVTELNERFRIWKVQQEATDEWLSNMHSQFVRDGIEPAARADLAMQRWAEQNHFRVLRGSRRAKRIEHFFDVAAAGEKGERRGRCQHRWSTAYGADSYLHHLDEANLRARLEAVMANLLFADRGALPHELTELEWRQLFHEILIEFERRHISSMQAIRDTNILQAWPHLDQARAEFARYTGKRGQLFRFSKRKHLEPLLHTGDLVLVPATTYDDPSLRPSQRDDELARSILADGTTAQLEHIDRQGVRRPIKAIGSIRLTMSTPTNYYVWCTSSTYDPRLFDDFSADACLILHDAPAFTQRFLAAVTKALPRWVPGEKLVQYFDPLRTTQKVLGPFHKDFRYAYQREYRFVWDPPSPEIFKALPPIRLSLGSLATSRRSSLCDRDHSESPPNYAQQPTRAAPAFSRVLYFSACGPRG